MTAIDVHQHLWPERLLSALAARRHPPRLVRAPAGWELLLDAEPPSPILPTDHDPERRAALVEADGLDGALIALSSPLGIEALPADEAEPLLDALPRGRAGARGALRLVGRGRARRGRGRTRSTGCSPRAPPASRSPRGALASRRGLDRVGPLLERRRAPRRAAVRASRPGAVAADGVDGADAPGWWPALTAYVTQLHEAWHAWMAWGRDAAPAAHASSGRCSPAARRCTPSGSRRAAGRSGRDLFSFYDVSSYGLGAIDAMAGAVGADRLVHGSDRPVVGPPALPRRARAARCRPTRRLPAAEAVAA